MRGNECLPSQQQLIQSRRRWCISIVQHPLPDLERHQFWIFMVTYLDRNIFPSSFDHQTIDCAIIPYSSVFRPFLFSLHCRVISRKIWKCTYIDSLVRAKSRLISLIHNLHHQQHSIFFSVFSKFGKRLSNLLFSNHL